MSVSIRSPIMTVSSECAPRYLRAMRTISGFGKQVKVRVIFQVKSMNNMGEVMLVQQVDDEQYYQDFFSKVDKGIFIQKEGI